MTDWKKLFTKRILDRGYGIWLAGAVDEVTETDEEFSAIVHGGEDYLVSIVKDEDRISDCDCDCPYAEDGNYCKHMAALFYTLDATDTGNENSPDSKAKRLSLRDTVSLEEVIGQLSEEITRKELLSAARKDDILAARLMAEYAAGEYSKSDSVDKEPAEQEWSEYVRTMRRTVDTIIDNYTDSSGFADWRNGSKLVYALDRNVIQELLEIAEYAAQYHAAMDLALYLCEQYASILIDGSNGEHQAFTDSMDDLWDALYTVADNEQRRSMFREMLDLYEKVKQSEECLADSLLSFLTTHFDKQTLYRRQLSIVEKEIEEEEATVAEQSEQRSKRTRSVIAYSPQKALGTYHFSHLVMMKINLLKTLGADQHETLEFQNKYRWLPVVRRAEMEELQTEGKLTELIALLEESKELDKDERYLVSHYSRQLIDCYEKAGLTEKAHDEVYRFVTHYSPADLEGFKLYKGLYSADQWEMQRELVFRAIGSSHNLNCLYREEELYDRILENIEIEAKRTGVYTHIILAELARYEDVLRPGFDQQLLMLYEGIARNMAKPASGRAGYQEIVRVLQRMLDYPNGKETVDRLIVTWRSTYSNRPAMQDELRWVYTKRK